MKHLKFLDPSRDPSVAMQGEYDLLLVGVSVLMASSAAYAALGLAGRISASEKPLAQRLWLLVGAGAMGIGIWAMHFIGMLAFRLPVPVTYDLRLTLVSVLPGIVASGVVIFVTSRARIRGPQLALGGILMGLGIGTMHYSGMAAMRMAAAMFYDPLLFGGSIVVAAALAATALYIHFLAGGVGKAPGPFVRLGAACTMGFAVSGMHYTGMAAAYFFPVSAPQPLSTGLDPMLLAVFVGLAAAFILALVIFVVVVDTRLKAAAHSVRTSRSRMVQAIESVSEGFCLYDAEDRWCYATAGTANYYVMGEWNLHSARRSSRLSAGLLRAISFPKLKAG